MKAGWRVKVLPKAHNDWTVGLVGTVVFASADFNGVLVEFSAEDAKGQGHGEGFRRWWIEEEALEVLAPKLAAPTVASDLKLTPQAKTVLAHMKSRGSISPMEAMIGHGISRLASCIHEIRHRAGYAVNTAIRQDEGGHKYARYSLVQQTVLN